MISKVLTIVAAAELVAVFSACAVFAGKSDYADYREIRLAKDDEQRLLAMQRYTEQHPEGRWYFEIQTERQEREAEVYETYKTDRAGLEFFIRAYPDGVYYPHARARLDAVVKVEERQFRNQKRVERLEAKRFSQNLVRGRSWPKRFFSFWIQNLLWINNWGSSVPRVAEANPEFSKAFGRVPRPVCSLHECAKVYFVNYAIPVPGQTRIDRNLRIILRLKLQNGMLRGAELLMPGRGFSRWYELVNGRIVVDEDPTDRQQAIEWSAHELMRILQKTRLEVKPVPGQQYEPIKPIRGDLVGIQIDTSSDDPLAVIEGRKIMERGAKKKKEKKKSIKELVKPTEEEVPDMVMAPLEVPPEGSYGSKSSDAQNQPAVQSNGSPKNSEKNLNENRKKAHNTSKLFTFQYRSLRGHIVAADPDELAPAYDGVVIELIKAE
jgi:hypothetical protein